jgi:hypothetical protein
MKLQLYLSYVIVRVLGVTTYSLCSYLIDAGERRLVNKYSIDKSQLNPDRGSTSLEVALYKLVYMYWSTTPYTCVERQKRPDPNTNYV